MADRSSASLCCFMFLSVFGFVSADQEIIPGQNVTLPCHANNKIPIIAVKWSRADLGKKFVLYYRDEQFVPVNQHPSFKNRVDLQDKQMKDGDVSLILSNVTINDTGTYECQVAQREPNQEIADLKIINTSKLSVVPPDQKNITAESGQDVILPCRTPNNKIVAIEWSKDLLNLLYYQIGQFDPDNQNPAYKNRVDLQDRQMKDGDVSLILKDVTINDAGTYRCYVAWGEPNQEASLKLICTINLSVVPPGRTGRREKDRSVGLKVGVTVFSLLFIVAVGFAV